MTPQERLKEIEANKKFLTNAEFEWLIARVKKLESVLEIYAITNETFPEYGNVARKALENE